MNYSDERKAIESFFSAAWGAVTTYGVIPVGYDGQTFPPDDTQPSAEWVTCSILNGDDVQVTLGSNPLYRFVGVIQNAINVAPNVGTDKARKMADAIAGIWRRAKFSNGSSGEIVCEDSPAIHPVEMAGGRLVLIVSTRYHRDVQT